MLLSSVFWAQLSKLSVQHYLRSPRVSKTYTLSWKLWHNRKMKLATYCRKSWKPIENPSWHWMFCAKATRSIPMEDITVQNIRLHLQENALKSIASLFYTHCYFCTFFFPPLLICSTLSQMHLVIFQKYFKFFTCPVHFPFCLLTYFKLLCSPSLMGQLWFQTEGTITT